MSKYKLCYICKFCKLNVIKIIYLINYICLKNICLQNYLLGKKLNKLIEFNKKKKNTFYKLYRCANKCKNASFK